MSVQFDWTLTLLFLLIPMIKQLPEMMVDNAWQILSHLQLPPEISIRQFAGSIPDIMVRTDLIKNNVNTKISVVYFNELWGARTNESWLKYFSCFFCLLPPSLFRVSLPLDPQMWFSDIFSCFQIYSRLSRCCTARVSMSTKYMVLPVQSH